MAQEGGSGGQSLPTRAHLLVQNGHRPNGGQHKTPLGACPQGPVPPEGKRPHHPCHHLPGQVGCSHPQPGRVGPDQTMAAIPRALTEAELYGYCWGQVVDLSPVMLAAQFQVIEEGGAYLCTARALVFEGSVLAYNPAMNEAEWVPVRGLANDLSWAEERSTVALANYVPRVPAEAARIASLGASWIVSCPGNDSSTSVEEVWHSDMQGTNPRTDTDPEPGDESKDRAGQTDLEDPAE